MATKAKKTSIAKRQPSAGVITDVKKTDTHIGGKVSVQIEIEPFVPPDMVIHYADNLNVIHTEHEAVLSFLQVQPPVLLEEDQEIHKVQSKCVARIIINPVRLPLFINTLIKNWNRYASQYVEGANVATDKQATETEK
jgi:hypothetical protein